MGDFNTYWQMTINNYDERDLALVRQGYPDDIRKLVYTLEEGAEGTPHVQAYIQMKRSVRLSHMRKLFPGAHFNSQTSKEWRLNQHNYAQKLDDTARSAAVIQNNDPLHSIEGTVRKVVERIIDEYGDAVELVDSRRLVERELVIEDYSMAKVFTSATYRAMWKEFGHEMFECLFQARAKRLENDADTHTHTHREKLFSVAEDITKDAEDDEGEDGSTDYGSEAGEDDEGFDDGEGSESEASAESDDSGCSESDAESQD